MVLNGSNLNLLGRREPQTDGHITLAMLEAELAPLATELGLGLACLQSNYEGALIDCIHAARGPVDAIIINSDGLTHASVALRDSLAGVAIPFIEMLACVTSEPAPSCTRCWLPRAAVFFPFASALWALLSLVASQMLGSTVGFYGLMLGAVLLASVLAAVVKAALVFALPCWTTVVLMLIPGLRWIHRTDHAERMTWPRPSCRTRGAAASWRST